MALKNIIITGSIGTHPTLSYGQKEYISSTDEQSFPIERITSNNGGSMPNLMGMTSSVNLYVNITQSWDVVTDTPVGLVSSIHNTQDEFINGEFSGSKIIAEDGKLIDEDCQQFLKVNTIEVNYEPYFYGTNITPLGEFLDVNTSPNSGEIYLLFNSSSLNNRPIEKGIKYIKVNRFDKQGNNNTLSLQELTNIRLEFSDLGIINFPIITISEYSDYYLYETNANLGESTSKFKSPTNPTSSANTYLLSSGNNVSPIFYGYTDTTGSINGNGLFDFPNGGYTVKATCIFSASLFNPTFKKQLIYVLFTGSNGIINKKPVNLNQPGIYSASISYVPTSGSTLGIAFASSSITVNLNVPSIDFRITQDVTSSIDNNVLNHNIEAIKSPPTTIAGDTSAIIGDYDEFPINPLGYFNSSSGLITFGDTPNIKIHLTASVSVLNSDIYFYLVGSSEGEIVSINASNDLGGTLTLSSSFTPVENSTYWLKIENTSSTPSTYSNVNLILTQSVDPYSLSVLTIPEPYLTTNFFYNDCNVLYGNADNLEYNNDFMLVNYDGDGGSVIPSNQQQILNNTAERAPVKPYNYTLQSQVFPRYNGVRVTQQNPNVWTEGDVAPDKTPSIKSTTTYFVYFTRVSNPYPILKDNATFTIKYLIDENGDIFTPNLNSSEYYNLINSFEGGKKAYASLLNNSISTNISSPQPIKISGNSYIPIISSISASTPTLVDWSDTMDFTNLDGTISPPNPTDYGFYREPQVGSPRLILSSSNLVVNIFEKGLETGQGQDLQNGYIQGTPNLYKWDPHYTFNGVPTTSVKMQAVIRPRIEWPYNGAIPSSVTIRLELWLKRGANRTILNQSENKTYTRLYSALTVINGGDAPYGTAIGVEHTYYPEPNDEVYALARHIGYTGTEATVILQYQNNYLFDTSFKIVTNALENASILEPFWVTGSSVYNDSSASISLTSSIQMGNVLNGSLKQISISSSGLEPFTNPAQILPGDEIRFEYDEANVYRVVESILNSPTLSTASAVLDITPFYTDASTVGSSSFDLNGIIFTLTGSNTLPNSTSPSIIYISSGSNSTTSAEALVLAINNSSSIAPYSASILTISASNSNANLNLFSTVPGSAGNSNYYVSASITSSFTGGDDAISRVYLTLDRPFPVSPSLNINHFLVRRKIKDFNVILNTFSTISDSGFLFPEYPSDKIVNNLNNITKNLSEKGLL